MLCSFSLLAQRKRTKRKGSLSFRRSTTILFVKLAKLANAQTIASLDTLYDQVEPRLQRLWHITK